MTAPQPDDITRGISLVQPRLHHAGPCGWRTACWRAECREKFGPYLTVRGPRRRGPRPLSRRFSPQGRTWTVAGFRMTEREFRALPGTDGYLLELPKLGTELRVERIRRERGELVAELTVASSLPGTRSPNGVLHVADFNLSSARARTERARIIADRANTTDIDWTGVLEDLCQSTIAAERAGQPAVALRDVPAPPADDSIVIDGVRMPGGCRCACSVTAATARAARAVPGRRADADGDAGPLADWEFSGEDHRERLERLTGPIMPAGILYAHCERPLVDEADRLRRIVREEASITCVRLGRVRVRRPARGRRGRGPLLPRPAADRRRVTQHRPRSPGERRAEAVRFVVLAQRLRSRRVIKRSDENVGDGLISVGLFNRKSTGPLAAARLPDRVQATSRRRRAQSTSPTSRTREQGAGRPADAVAPGPRGRADDGGHRRRRWTSRWTPS